MPISAKTQASSAAPGHGYFVAATSSICPEAPTENIVAMFDEHTKCLY